MTQRHSHSENLYTQMEQKQKAVIFEEESEESEEENGDWEDWREDGSDNGEEEGEDNEEESEELRLLCLFCCSKYGSCNELFEHCRLLHKFDFQGIRKTLGLDFYGAFKLINYVRSQVAENRCWTCGDTCQSNQDLQNHLHEALNVHDIKLFWDDDKYLKPFMQDDTLLYSFSEDEEDEDDYTVCVDKDELIKDLGNIEAITTINDDTTWKSSLSSCDNHVQNVTEHVASARNGQSMAGSSKMVTINGGSKGYVGSSCEKQVDMHSKSSIIVGKDIKKVNENYFGAYSSFSIHREMISDKVRMEAYGQAILKNPSLLTGAVVMDVGCGTGILSLFAALAGASRVIAVEASEKMAAVATQIAKDNHLWRSDGRTKGDNQCIGVIDVVQGMVEELEKSIQIELHSVDVLLSEWMGYCLLYESMLGSVLHARDRWLKPGGAILPDLATIYAVGFGRGGTSLPFWEDVYGFNMSCVGKELVQDAAQVPIVDTVDTGDLVTDAVVLQAFDLLTMKPSEVDFTASIDLEPKFDSLGNDSVEFTSKIVWCYGVVLWFDTAFSSRFCKETPAVLSTSPYSAKTHWSQTILTFREPIAMARGKACADKFAIGTEACPAARIHLRISIARATQHRSIDISLETSGVGVDGRRRCWPVQMFNLS